MKLSTIATLFIAPALALASTTSSTTGEEGSYVVTFPQESSWDDVKKAEHDIEQAVRPLLKPNSGFPILMLSEY